MPPPYEYEIIYDRIGLKFIMYMPSEMIWAELGISSKEVCGMLYWHKPDPQIRPYIEDYLHTCFYSKANLPLELGVEFKEDDLHCLEFLNELFKLPLVPTNSES
jgi:hypothetical protein